MDRAHDFLAVRAGESDREAWIEGPLLLVVVVVVVVVFVFVRGGEMAQGDEVETVRAVGFDWKMICFRSSSAEGFKGRFCGWLGFALTCVFRRRGWRRRQCCYWWWWKG